MRYKHIKAYEKLHKKSTPRRTQVRDNIINVTLRKNRLAALVNHLAV